VILSSFSGCGIKVKYLPCPEYKPKTLPPVLDLNGSMKRISITKWEVDHSVVLGVKSFEKACYERSADFESTTKAINAYNKEIDKD
jgi:hypothetical protein